MADRQLVLAVYPDELAADGAAAALKDSGIADGDAIGILALDDDGRLKQDKVGAHSTGKGAAIGGVIAVFSTALLGPAVLTGVAVGALHHKNLGLMALSRACSASTRGDRWRRARRVTGAPPDHLQCRLLIRRPLCRRQPGEPRR